MLVCDSMKENPASCKAKTTDVTTSSDILTNRVDSTSWKRLSTIPLSAIIRHFPSAHEHNYLISRSVCRGSENSQLSIQRVCSFVMNMYYEYLLWQCISIMQVWNISTSLEETWDLSEYGRGSGSTFMWRVDHGAIIDSARKLYNIYNPRRRRRRYNFQPWKSIDEVNSL